MSKPLGTIPVTQAPVPSDYLATPNLEVIDPDGALEQCCDWSFVVELLGDVLKEKEETITSLNEATAGNDHTKFHRAAHALKGAALNLHLPALANVSWKAECLGKQLEATPSHAELLSIRKSLIEHMELEFQRLEDYLPEARENAAAEAENGDEGNADRDGEEDEEGEGEEDEEGVVYEDENGTIVDKDGNPIENK